MLNVVAVTSPIFLLIATGFWAVRVGWLSQSETRALGAFVLRLAMPALIFKSLASRPPRETVDLRLLAGYAGASALAFAAAYALSASHGRKPAALRALGGAAPNSGFVGFPVASLLVGPPAGVALAVCLIVENVMTIPLGLALAESGGGMISRLMRNPLLVAIAVGLTASLLGFYPPPFLARGLDILAAAAPGAALVAIGGGLNGLDFGVELRGLAPVAAVKLLLHPLLMLAALKLTGADGPVARAMLTLASAPVFSIYPLICRPFGEEKAGAALLLLETALAFPTMSLFLALEG